VKKAEDLKTLEWLEPGAIRIVDQTVLPGKLRFVTVRTVEQAALAIETMQIRGAPAIGVMAAMGVALGAVRFRGASPEGFACYMEDVCERLARTRPTAVNLFWAIDRMRGVLAAKRGGTVAAARKALVTEAKRMYAEDIRINRRIGDNGAALLKKGTRILTHCNAGAFATAGYGTALGVIRSGRRMGLIAHVYADETRPRLQGAKLTAFELCRENIPATLITDNMAAHLMHRGEIDCAVVGADRIAANGDTANKIGTYGVAVLCRHHGIPFYVAAPVSTVDPGIPDGGHIVVEERGEEEVRYAGGSALCPSGIRVINPSFDVTPAALVTAIITEAGVCRPPYERSLRGALRKAGSRTP
jgi:methylthioribose-1-phosphate isomerase